jgi:hypothetical protein
MASHTVRLRVADDARLVAATPLSDRQDLSGGGATI